MSFCLRNGATGTEGDGGGLPARFERRKTADRPMENGSSDHTDLIYDRFHHEMRVGLGVGSLHRGCARIEPIAVSDAILARESVVLALHSFIQPESHVARPSAKD